jgi:phosphohistidine phosphatase
MSSKKLLLMRHAKSDWDIEVIDSQRPLKKRGKRDAVMMSHWLLAKNLIPQLIYVSPAERALATAKKVRKTMELDKGMLKIEERIYNSNPVLMKDVLHGTPEALNLIMLVGHNPALEDLLADLVDEPMLIPADGKLLPTSALAELSFEGNWRDVNTHQMKLQGIMRVKHLYPQEINDSPISN